MHRSFVMPLKPVTPACIVSETTSNNAFKNNEILIHIAKSNYVCKFDDYFVKENISATS